MTQHLPTITHITAADGSLLTVATRSKHGELFVDVFRQPRDGPILSAVLTARTGAPIEATPISVPATSPPPAPSPTPEFVDVVRSCMWHAEQDRIAKYPTLTAATFEGAMRYQIRRERDRLAEAGIRPHFDPK